MYILCLFHYKMNKKINKIEETRQKDNKIKYIVTYYTVGYSLSLDEYTEMK